MSGGKNPSPNSRAIGQCGPGLIQFFTLHHTAHNLLMALMVLAGLTSVLAMRKQFFPDIEIPVVNVSIGFPGATALQVDRGIVEVLEPICVNCPMWLRWGQHPVMGWHPFSRVSNRHRHGPSCC